MPLLYVARCRMPIIPLKWYSSVRVSSRLLRHGWHFFCHFFQFLNDVASLPKMVGITVIVVSQYDFFSYT